MSIDNEKEKELGSDEQQVVTDPEKLVKAQATPHELKVDLDKPTVAAVSAKTVATVPKIQKAVQGWESFGPSWGESLPDETPKVSDFFPNKDPSAPSPEGPVRTAVPQNFKNQRFFNIDWALFKPSYMYVSYRWMRNFAIFCAVFGVMFLVLAHFVPIEVNGRLGVGMNDFDIRFTQDWFTITEGGTLFSAPVTQMVRILGVTDNNLTALFVIGILGMLMLMAFPFLVYRARNLRIKAIQENRDLPKLGIVIYDANNYPLFKESNYNLF